jgi:hypothetical protein
MWDSYSPDLREFIGQMTYDYDESNVFSVVS